MRGHVYVCWGFNFAYLYDFSMGFWKCSDSVIFFVFQCISFWLWAYLQNGSPGMQRYICVFFIAFLFYIFQIITLLVHVFQIIITLLVHVFQMIILTVYILQMITFHVYIFQMMFQYTTSLIALVAVIYWYRYKPHPDQVFNIQLNFSYDYIIGKLCLIVIFTYLRNNVI